MGKFTDQYLKREVSFNDIEISGPVRAMANYWKMKDDHIRKSAIYPYAGVTLRLLMDLAKLLDCEVGAFVSKDQIGAFSPAREQVKPLPPLPHLKPLPPLPHEKPLPPLPHEKPLPKQPHVERVCIGLGEDVYCQRPGIGEDRKKLYKFIAHSHPTMSTEKLQLTKDLCKSDNQVEVAVNANGLIMYFSEGHIYNKRKGIGGEQLGEEIETRIQGDHKFKPGTLTLDTVLTPDTLKQLGVWEPPARQGNRRSTEETSNGLFDDDLVLTMDGSDSE